MLTISAVCAEFGCTPSQAARELDDDPEHVVLDVMEARAYQRCKAAYDEQDEKALERLRSEDPGLLDTVERNTQEIVMGRRPRLGTRKADGA